VRARIRRNAAVKALTPPFPGKLVLPEPHQTRWTPKTKVVVLEAIHAGLITMSDACERYSLSLEEIATWSTRASRYGEAGLRATRLRDYR
jgi:hypothetical protein